jgi:hypothetical protein
MRYISNTVNTAICSKCDFVHPCSARTDWDEDSYADADESECPVCGWPAWTMADDIFLAKWWSVALYECGPAYGGPEEGGWYYDTGILVSPNKIRVFEGHRKEAQDYYDQLKQECKDGVWDSITRVVGFTESLPVDGWPNKKPFYS